MTNNDKLEKLKKLADAMYYAAQYLTTDASRLHKAMDEYHKFIINEYHKEEPTIPDIVDEHFYEMLGKEPASENYKNALNSVAITFLQEQQIVPNFYADIIMKAVKRGANWQKEQLLAKAVDAVVKIDAGGYPYVDSTIELYDYDKDIPLAKRGDKVKILVIRES
jgi:uncharacterized protein with ATP-grasp and redox domains